MVGTHDSTNEKHKFYNSTVQDISRGGGDCATKFGSLCARFVDMEYPVNNQVGNGLSKLFYFRGQTIDVSDQAIFILKDSGLHDEEGKKTNINNPITAGQRRSGHFLSLMMTANTDQADPNCKQNHMTCWVCIQLPLDVYGIDASINTQMIKNP